MSPATSAEVAIVGSGLVGAALAVALARGGIQVAVVEARRYAPRPRPEPFDLRVYALSLGSVRFLDAIGVWGRLPRERVQPFREMRVWDAGSRGSVHFDCASLPAPALGCVVEDWAVQAALEATLAELPTVRWCRPAALRGLLACPDAVDAVLDPGRVRARLVVGADGTRSAVRECLRIRSRGASYGQRAVVATVRTALDPAATAWQRFLPGGPLAFLPLPGGLSSVVWSAPEEEAEALLALDETGFRHALGAAFEHRLGRVEEVWGRAAFPLEWLDVERYVGERAALVGDAAHTIHPLAGQGVNLGLLDAATLAELVLDARERGRDPGSYSLLRRYERWRKAHNRYVAAAMSALLWLFGRSDPGWRALRGLGLGLTDRLEGVKGVLGSLAMGVGGDLPAVYRDPRPEP